MALSNDKEYLISKNLETKFLSKITKIKKFIPKKFLKLYLFLLFIFYLILRKHKNFYFYIEHYFLKVL